MSDFLLDRNIIVGLAGPDAIYPSLTKITPATTMPDGGTTHTLTGLGFTASGGLVSVVSDGKTWGLSGTSDTERTIISPYGMAASASGYDLVCTWADGTVRMLYGAVVVIESDIVGDGTILGALQDIYNKQKGMDNKLNAKGEYKKVDGNWYWIKYAPDDTTPVLIQLLEQITGYNEDGEPITAPVDDSFIVGTGAPAIIGRNSVVYSYPSVNLNSKTIMEAIQMCYQLLVKMDKYETNKNMVLKNAGQYHLETFDDNGATRIRRCLLEKYGGGAINPVENSGTPSIRNKSTV